MKKITLLVASLLVSASMMINASAITKSELLAKMTKTYNINGAVYKLSSDKAVLAEEYLQQNNLSESDMNYISGKIDEAITAISNDGAKSVSSLKSTTVSKIKSLVTDVSNNTAVKATIVSNNTILVKNIDGTDFAKVGSNDFIRQTNDFNLVLTAGSISLLGIGLALTKIRR